MKYRRWFIIQGLQMILGPFLLCWMEGETEMIIVFSFVFLGLSFLFGIGGGFDIDDEIENERKHS